MSSTKCLAGNKRAYAPPRASADARALTEPRRAAFAALLLVLQNARRQGDCRRAQEWYAHTVHPIKTIKARFTRIPRTFRSCADLAIRGTLHSVDQYLNIKLLGVSVEDAANFPHLQSVKNCFIRGSVIKYVQLPASEVDTELLQDAARREAVQQKGGT